LPKKKLELLPILSGVSAMIRSAYHSTIRSTTIRLKLVLFVQTKNDENPNSPSALQIVSVAAAEYSATPKANLNNTYANIPFRFFLLDKLGCAIAGYGRDRSDNNICAKLANLEI